MTVQENKENHKCKGETTSFIHKFNKYLGEDVFQQMESCFELKIISWERHFMIKKIINFTLHKWVSFYPLFVFDCSPSSEFSLHHCFEALENIFFLGIICQLKVLLLQHLD
jgi:hypothetical protein